ncbi:MAG: LysR family transcriptional regulator [Balneolaceae bacterium]
MIKQVSLNLRRINIFLTVAKHLSYTKAARELYISQPAITKNIQMLEDELGVCLFNRKGNTIELTHEGKLVYSFGSDIDQQVQNLMYELGQINSKQKGNLRIGASSTISHYFIPPVIARFKESNPGLSISLLSGNTSEINARLNDDLIDVGITEGYRRLNNFDYYSFLNDEIAFISHKNNPVHFPETFSKEKLAELPLVLRETGSGTREVFEKAIKGVGLTLNDLNITITLGSTESIKSYLIDSEALGVFSTSAIRKNEENLFKISRLEKTLVTRRFQFMVKQGSAHKLGKEFIRFSKKYYNL